MSVGFTANLIFWGFAACVACCFVFHSSLRRMLPPRRLAHVFRATGLIPVVATLLVLVWPQTFPGNFAGLAWIFGLLIGALWLVTRPHYSIGWGPVAEEDSDRLTYGLLLPLVVAYWVGFTTAGGIALRGGWV